MNSAENMVPGEMTVRIHPQYPHNPQKECQEGNFEDFEDIKDRCCSSKETVISAREQYAKDGHAPGSESIPCRKSQDQEEADREVRILVGVAVYLCPMQWNTGVASTFWGCCWRVEGAEECYHQVHPP